MPLYFKNPRNNCLPNNKDPGLERQRCLTKEPTRSLSTHNNTGVTPWIQAGTREVKIPKLRKKIPPPPKRLTTAMSGTTIAETNAFHICQTA